MHPHKTGKSRIENRPLYRETANRVRPVENDDRNVTVAGRLHDERQRGGVGVVPTSDVLAIEQNRVEVAELVGVTRRLVAIPIVLLHTLVSGRSKSILHVLQEQSAGIVAARSGQGG